MHAQEPDYQEGDENHKQGAIKLNESIILTAVLYNFIKSLTFTTYGNITF